MHSQHFDPTVYNNSLYGTVAGYDPSALKLQHTGYGGENETNYYSNYVSSTNSQILHSYGGGGGGGGREPPSYPDTTGSFFHPSFVPSFGGASYYKSPGNTTLDINEYNQPSSLGSRTPESFLLRSPDPETMGALNNGYSCNGENIVSGSSPVHNRTNINNSTAHINTSIVPNSGAVLTDGTQPHEDHGHHNIHQPSLHSDHLQLPIAYGEETQGVVLNSPKINQQNSFFGPSASIKLEPSTSSQQEMDKVISSSMTSCSITSQKSPHKSSSEKPGAQQRSTSKCNSLQQDVGSNDSSESDKPMNRNNDKIDDVKNNEEKKEDPEGKPTMSYIALIAKAILESDQRRLNLGSIYNWIEKHYPFYKNKGQGWRNSVRHNLSLNDCFIKAGRCEDGKGNYWAIHPANIQDFMRGDFRQRRRSRRRGRKKECDLSMYNMANGYLPPSGAALASGMALNPAALSSIYSPYTEAERRAYRLDEALLRQSMNNPFVKWYQHGVTTPTFCPSTSPSTCSSGVYPNTGTMQWTQGYADTNHQSMYQTLNPSFPRHYPSTPVL